MQSCGASEWLTLYAVLVAVGFISVGLINIGYLLVHARLAWRKVGCMVHESGKQYSYCLGGITYRSGNVSMATELPLFRDHREVPAGENVCFVKKTDYTHARLRNDIRSWSDIFFMVAGLIVLPVGARYSVPVCVTALENYHLAFVAAGSLLWLGGKILIGRAAKSRIEDS